MSGMVRQRRTRIMKRKEGMAHNAMPGLWPPGPRDHQDRRVRYFYLQLHGGEDEPRLAPLRSVLGPHRRVVSGDLRITIYLLSGGLTRTYPGIA